MPINRRLDNKEVLPIQNGILLGHKKRMKSTICDNMDEPRGHYAKWNKSGIEQIPEDFTYMWNL